MISRKLVQDIVDMRKSLFAFVVGAWDFVAESPLEQYDQIDLICQYLEALYHGETRKLVINLPPGTGKSRICSVLFPVWCWIQDPTVSILACSHAYKLGRDFGEKIVALMSSAWFKERFLPRLVGAKPSAVDFALEQGGWRLVVSPHGAVTGHHGDIRIVDDPVKPEDAYTDRKEIENLTRWFADTWLSRAKDQRTVRDLLVMQRLTEVDPSQYAIDHGWSSLVLPARFEPGRYPPVGPLGLPTDWRATEGQLLDRMTDALLDGPEMTPYVYAAQYQQRPSAEGTRIFTEASLSNTYDIPPTIGQWCISCDAAFKAEATSDYVAVQVWCRTGPKYYLVDAIQARLTFTETCAALERVAAKYPRARAKLIEDKANGSAIIDALGKKMGGLLAVNPEGGKVSRANAIQPLFAAGNIVLPASAPWLDAYRREMMLFPLGKNDDQVDCTTQALVWLSDRAQRIGAIDDEMMAALTGTHVQTAAPSGYQEWRARRAR